MAIVELLMPKMGESVMEGTVLSWLKAVGDTIEEDESILEVATDKVDTEIPSTHGGVLKEILAQEGDVVEVGKPIAIIETDVKATTSSKTEAPEESTHDAVAQAEQIIEKAKGTIATAIPAKVGDKFFSPLVRNIAKEEGVSIEELSSIKGSGKDNRVTKEDILNYLKAKNHSPAPVEIKTKPTPAPAPVVMSGEDEIIQMDRMRKMIAERMLASKQIAPHVTSFVEADVTEVVLWRGKMKKVFAEREGQVLTYTPIMIEAVVKAIKDYPMINIQVDGDKIIKKKSINIGLAVALPSGNLIVPVIHNADQLSLLGIT
ncbi:MAG: 2-oxoglutarate dehydrogenase E2 component (dihydrolipoamide succinyltransferase), partial [Marinoscillum sp.]